MDDSHRKVRCSVYKGSMYPEPAVHMGEAVMQGVCGRVLLTHARFQNNGHVFEKAMKWHEINRIEYSWHCFLFRPNRLSQSSPASASRSDE